MPPEAGLRRVTVGGTVLVNVAGRIVAVGVFDGVGVRVGVGGSGVSVGVSVGDGS